MKFNQFSEWNKTDLLVELCLFQLCRCECIVVANFVIVRMETKVVKSPIRTQKRKVEKRVWKQQKKARREGVRALAKIEEGTGEWNQACEKTTAKYIEIKYSEKPKVDYIVENRKLHPGKQSPSSKFQGTSLITLL